MLRVAVHLWLGTAAAVLCGRWGAVTRRAREVGDSRPAISHHAQRVTHAGVHAPEGGGSAETLGAENTRRRAENAALWEAGGTAEPLPESQQQACAATGSARGLSLGPILLLLAILLPQGSPPSRATVGRWVAQARRQAGGRLAGLAQCCQRWVLVLCLEAIVCHRRPIFMAVEPHSRAWVAAQRGPARSGERGGQVWAKWPCVTRVVAAAGQGLERGVTLAREARRTAAEGQENTATGPRQRGRDVLHTQRARQRVGQGTWPRAARP
jgi:hypothetical protein